MMGMADVTKATTPSTKLVTAIAEVESAVFRAGGA